MMSWYVETYLYWPTGIVTATILCACWCWCRGNRGVQEKGVVVSVVPSMQGKEVVVPCMQEKVVVDSRIQEKGMVVSEVPSIQGKRLLVPGMQEKVVVDPSMQKVVVVDPSTPENMVLPSVKGMVVYPTIPTVYHGMTNAYNSENVKIVQEFRYEEDIPCHTIQERLDYQSTRYYRY